MVLSCCRTLLVTLIVFLTAQQTASSQGYIFPNELQSDLSITQSGKSVAVRIADPFAIAEQERALIRYLNATIDPSWDRVYTIVDLQRELQTCHVIRVDVHALDVAGLSLDSPVFLGHQAVSPKSLRTQNNSDDPFSSQAIASQREEPTAEVASSPSGKGWWKQQWKAHTFRSENRSRTNAAVLFESLASLELCLTTRMGQWIITTEDFAEDHPSNRLYDVTPFSDLEISEPAYGFGRLASPPNSLVELVEETVEPDNWISNGGLSTCRVVRTGGRCWLVVSAPVMTQWKVQSLLNQLNES